MEAIDLGRSFSNALAVAAAFVEAVESALALGRPQIVDQLFAQVERLPPGVDSQSLHAQRRRLGARIAAQQGEPDKVEQGFKRAAAAFRELAVPFWLGVTVLEHGEWLVSEGRLAEAEPLLAEAGEILERLGAAPYLERLEHVRPQAAVA
jgi:hypothetical protein